MGNSLGKLYDAFRNMTKYGEKQIDIDELNGILDKGCNDIEWFEGGFIKRKYYTQNEALNGTYIKTTPLIHASGMSTDVIAIKILNLMVAHKKKRNEEKKKEREKKREAMNNSSVSIVEPDENAELVKILEYSEEYTTNSALKNACARKHYKLIMMLLTYIKPTQESTRKFLGGGMVYHLDGRVSQNREYIRQYLSAVPDFAAMTFTREKYNALQYYIHNNEVLHPSVLVLLIEGGCDVNYRNTEGTTAMMTIISSYNYSKTLYTFESTLAYHLDYYRKGVDDLLKQCVNDDMIDMTVSGNSHGDTLLHFISRYGSVNTFLSVKDKLLKEDYNVKNNSGHNPMHTALLCNKPEMAKVLITGGSEVYVDDDAIIDKMEVYGNVLFAPPPVV